jgi:hypothetical protein
MHSAEGAVGSDWFSRFFDTFGLKLAAWAGLLMVGVHWFRAKNERRRDDADERGGDFSRLRAEIKRLDERCDHLQREVDECREREGGWMQRAIAAEAYQAGRGQAAQDVTIFEASKRLPPPDGGTNG